MAARSCLRSDDKAPTLPRNNSTQTSDAYCNCNFTQNFYFLDWVLLGLFAMFWESLS